MNDKDTKRVGLVQKMLELIDECDGSSDNCKQVLAAAIAVRSIKYPVFAAKKPTSLVSSDVEEEYDAEDQR